jgi:RimJ/RimL family protein N-acetyltransferase
MFTLETERLLLRDWKRADWKDVQSYATDPEVSRYMIWGPNSEAQTKEFIETAIDVAYSKPRRGYELAIVWKETESIIGGFGLQIMGKESATAMIGYVLHRQHWGRGVVTEAARGMMTFGFTKLNLHRIYATCDTENVGSYRVMEKLGMRREGQFMQDTFIKGRWRDTYLYAILEKEWRELQNLAGIAGSVG